MSDEAEYEQDFDELCPICMTRLQGSVCGCFRDERDAKERMNKDSAYLSIVRRRIGLL